MLLIGGGVGLGFFNPGKEQVQVALAQPCFFSGLFQFLKRIFAYRFEQAVTCLGAANCLRHHQ